MGTDVHCWLLSDRLHLVRRASDRPSVQSSQSFHPSRSIFIAKSVIDAFDEGFDGGLRVSTPVGLTVGLWPSWQLAEPKREPG
jgi:hypothetical protein